MVSKCANPKCSKRFLYFGRGKLLVVDRRQRSNGDGDEFTGSRSAPELFWLCDECAALAHFLFSGEKRGEPIHSLAAEFRPGANVA
jgi:hypothetical protein